MSLGRTSLFLIDGYALIYRAFFAMISRPLTTSKGENTSAVWGVANFLVRLVREHQPEYVAWIHDAGSSFRKDIYPEYKATREKLDEELQEQFDQSLTRIESLLEAFGVSLVAVPGYEADDVIGTLAARASEEGRSVVIVSGDKDFYQLINQHVSLLNPGRRGPSAVAETWVTPENAGERLGVEPEQVVDYLALVGDSSDNVPGVKGVGAKTATALIGEYGDLDSILAHASKIKGKRAREALENGGEHALLSRDLVTIKRDVPVDIELDQLRRRKPNARRLSQIFSELEFHSLIPQITAASSDAEPQPAESTAPAEAPIVEIVGDAGQVAAAVAALKQLDQFAIKVVSSDVNPHRGHLVGFCISPPVGAAYYFPIAHSDGMNLILEEPSLDPVRELLADSGIGKIGHDVKREWLALRKAGVDLGGASYDLLLASFIADPGRRSHQLPALALDVLGVPLKSWSELVGRGKAELSIGSLPRRAVAEFAAAHTAAVLQIKESFADRLMDLAASRLFHEVELPLLEVLVDMEWAGIRVDLAELSRLSRDFARQLEIIERNIFEEAGVEFNINSTPQLRHVLFEKLQLPVLKKTKTGPSTDADVLAQLAATGFRLPALLLEYRELTKLKSTYVDALPGNVAERTGRIHTTFVQIGATTGRLSSHDPNLQNIPVRTERGGLIRRCFIPSEGNRFVVADYSQIELRLLAHLSRDGLLVDAFNKGGDVHRQTASVVFDVELEEVTSEMRERAKTINFATIYGQGAFALSNQLGISRDEARQFIDLYFERFAGVRRYLDGQVEFARRHGFVETIFGRRRYIPELRDRKHAVRAFGERTAMNSPLQGSAADLIKVAMVKVARRIGEVSDNARMLLQVHDELVFEVPASAVDEIAQAVRSEMETAVALSVPLVVDVGIGLNWLDAKN